MNKKIKKILKPIYLFFKQLLILNIRKTLYINFKTQSLRDAIKFPIFVFGRLKILSLKGDIILNSPIRKGMIKIGYNIDGVPLSYLPNQLMVSGKLTFKGYAIIGKGATVSVDGELLIGHCCTIGSGSFIKCVHSITIGNNTQITYDCTVFDCNMHYLKDINTGKIKNNRAQIIIGKNCWINAKTYIAKGSVVPDYSITAGGSFLNKDYSSDGNSLFLIGSPAKPINLKVQRIFDIHEEIRLSEYFKNNPDEKEITSDVDVNSNDNNELYFENLF